MISAFELLFMFLLNFCIYSSDICLFKSFADFFKWVEKGWPDMFNANNQQRTGVAILVLDKIDFKLQKTKKNIKY